MDAPRAIVLVKLSAIGDVLHGVPAAVALKRAFPATRIGWVVEGRAADVLAGHPAIDHLFRLPRGWLKSWQAVQSLRRQLLDFRADVAIDMQGLLKSAVPTWLSGAPLRIGHARPESREGAWLASTLSVPVTAAHVVDRNCGLLEPLGLRETTPSFEMPDWPVSRDQSRRRLAVEDLARGAVCGGGPGAPRPPWPDVADCLGWRPGAGQRRTDCCGCATRHSRCATDHAPGSRRSLQARAALCLGRYRSAPPRGRGRHPLRRPLRPGARRSQRSLRQHAHHDRAAGFAAASVGRSQDRHARDGGNRRRPRGDSVRTAGPPRPPDYRVGSDRKDLVELLDLPDLFGRRLEARFEAVPQECVGIGRGERQACE